MATIKSFTDLSQSKTLSKILSPESADMRYGYIAPYDYSDRMYDGGYDEIPYPKDFLIKNPNFSANEYDAELPCWSLSALLEHFFIPLLTKTPEGWQLSCLTIKGHKPMVVEGCSDPIEACYKMIVKLYELKML